MKSNIPLSILLGFLLLIGQDSRGQSAAISRNELPKQPQTVIPIDSSPQTLDISTVISGATVAELSPAFVEMAKDVSIGIWPNPGNGHFTISIHNAAITSMNVQIINCIGEVVGQQKMDFSAAQNMPLNVSHLNSGIYLCKMEANDHVTVRKLIINR